MMKKQFLSCFACTLFGCLSAQDYTSLYYDLRPEYRQGIDSCALYDPVINTWYYRAPAFFDWDNDGLKDLFFGRQDGKVSYFRNVGTAVSPCFVQMTDAFGNLFVPFGNSSPAIADMNADGKPDFIIGNGQTASLGGFLSYFQNVGTSLTPAFVLVQDTVAGYDLSDNAIPFLVDIDYDGDFDLFVGEGYGRLTFIENTGTPQNPAWDNPHQTFDDLGWQTAPQVVNIRGDSLREVVSAESYGSLVVYNNVSPMPLDTAVWQQMSGSLSGIDACTNGSGCLVQIAFADLNDDDLPDLLIASGGTARLLFNTGTAEAPVFNQAAGEPLSRAGNASLPAAFADLDHDGSMEMYLPKQNGQVRVYKNTGTSGTPLWTLLDDDFLHFTSTFPKSLAFGDLDGNGHTDLVVGNLASTVSLPKIQIYLSQAGVLAYTPAPSLENFPFYSSPVLPEVVDLYNDGVMDLIVKNSLAWRFTNPAGNGTDWVQADLAMFAGSNVSGTKVTFGDVDHDGDQDAVASGVNFPLFYENTGTDAQPAFVPKSYFMNTLPGGYATLANLTDDCGLELYLDNQFWVYDGIRPYIKPVSPATICANAAPRKLLAEPEGGWWEGADSSGYFHPDQPPGAYLVVYHYLDLWDCIARSDSVWLFVSPVPDAEFATLNGVPLDGDTVFVCVDAGPQILAPATPCGYYSGLASSTGQFNPVFFGLGTRLVTYYCSQNSCTDYDTLFITVVPPPSPVIDLLNGAPISGSSISVCQNAGLQTLGASPAGGVYGGVAAPDGTIDPGGLAPGAYQASYTVAQFGCTATHSITVQIKPLPDPEILSVGGISATSDSVALCQTDTMLFLIPAQPGGIFSPANAFNPADLPAGPYAFDYTISQNGCVMNSGVTVFIYPFPDPAIATVNNLPLLNDTVWAHIDSGLLVLSPVQPGGIFTGTTNPGGVVDPQLLGEGFHPVIYSIESNGCSASAKLVIAVFGGSVGAVEGYPDVLDVVVMPNPTARTASISFLLTRSGAVSLALFTADGRIVQDFRTQENLPAGRQISTFDIPAEMPRGLYRIALRINGRVFMKTIAKG